MSHPLPRALWRAGACGLLHLAVAAALLPRAAFLGEAFFDRDLHADWYPRARVFLDSVRAGLPPLWDLSIGFGQPLLADPSGQVLYPTTWLLLLLPPSAVYTVFVLGHLAFAGAGMTRLARAAGLRRPAALLAGLAWMLGGPLVSLADLWQHLAGAAWMPWVVMATHRLARRPGAAAAIRLGACLGLQVLAGSADLLLLTAVAAAGWALAVCRRPTLPYARRVVWAGVAGVALAAAVSAGQWLPAVEQARRGMRSVMPAGQSTQFSVPPAGMARVLLPLDASGRLGFTSTAREALFDSTRPPFLGSLYVGSIVTALACAAAAAGRRRAIALAALALLSALAALGRHFPFFGLLVLVVPGAGHLRYPSKAMVLFAFAVALLAGLGLSSSLRRSRARSAAAAAALFCVLGLAGASALSGPLLARATDGGLFQAREGLAMDALAPSMRLLAHAVGGALFLVWLWRQRRAVEQRRSPSALPLLWLAGDLVLAHYDLHPTAARRLLDLEPPVLAAIDRREGARTYVYEYQRVEGASERRLGRPHAYAIVQPPAGTDPRPLAVLASRIYPVPPVLGAWGVEGSYDLDLRGLQPLPLWGLTASLRAAEGTPAHERLLRLGAVRTVVALHREGFEELIPGPTFASLFPERIRTFYVPDALPRARAVPRARALEGRASLEALFAPDFDPAAEVILSGPDAGAAAARLTGTGRGRVTIDELRGERMRLSVDLDGPGVVTTADAYDPGWRAWVDGVPTPVLRANVAFRAVAVPAGRHVLELRYRPPAVLWGLSLSVTGAIVLAAGALLTRRRRVSPASSTSSAGSPAGSASAGGSPRA